VDALTGAPKGKIELGTHPSAMAINPATGDLYVHRIDGHEVALENGRPGGRGSSALG
jgi:hypothetical protein